ncbi:MAG: hypothetical protein ACFE96_17705 [Candidatus Hermodarchaeota archaeon]
MLVDSPEVLKARRIMVQHAYDEICAEKDINRFYIHTYSTLSKLGLNRAAQEEGFLTSKEDWSNPEHRGELLRNVKNFLIKHVR